MHTAKGRTGRTISPTYFRKLYREAADPWGFAVSPYERGKYDATLRALPRSRYRSALELGCSIGVFTAALARRCATLLGVDCSVDAVQAARKRCAAYRGVSIEECDLTCAFPRGRYDLVTFCELGYYFSVEDLACIRDRIAEALEPGGDLVLVHWSPLVPGHAQTADEVHAAFLDDPRFCFVSEERTAQYRLDILRRAGPIVAH